MNKQKLKQMLIMALILGIILISGCAQQPVGDQTNKENQSSETIAKQNMSAKEVISGLQDIKSSMDEIGDSLSN